MFRPSTCRRVLGVGWGIPLSCIAVLLWIGQVCAQTHPSQAAKIPQEKTIHYIPDSTAKLEQLIGDYDKERKAPTLGKTLTRAGVGGTDLGYSFEHDGHAWFLFGDTVGHVSYADDTMATTDATDPEKGVCLDFLTSRKGQYLNIAPPGVKMDAFDVPVGGISLDGKMYIIVRTDHSQTKDDDWSHDRTVLVRFIPPSKFETLRVISRRPAGKFLTLSLHQQPHSYEGLPDAGPWVFVWGTSEYRKSDLCLMIVPAKDFESGRDTRYFAGLGPNGAPKWGRSESDAEPVEKNGTMGDVSVTWCKDLGLWLMTYDRRQPTPCIAFSYSKSPWGPWSTPQNIFNPRRDGAIGKFIHNPSAKPPDGVSGPVIGIDEKDWESVHGGFYAPYVVERFTKVSGSELHLYYCLSTWNPYVVVLMKSRFQIE